MADAILATGLQINFGTSGYSARLAAISDIPIERAGVEWTPLDIVDPAANVTGNARFLPSKRVRVGPINCTFRLDPSLVPPMHGPIETITITFPLQQGEVTPAQWVAQGFFLTHNIQNGELDGLMDAVVSLEIDDGLTFIPAT